MYKPLIVLVFLSTALAGCLENDGQRALAGAAGGALVADAAGINPVTGALIGGAGGALCNDANIGFCQNN